MSEPSQDIEVLIQHYLEGRLTSEEATALHARIESEPALGERLLQELAMDAMLRATREPGLTVVPPAAPAPRKRFGFATLSGVAALAACITLLGTWAAYQALEIKPAGDEATTASVAVLTRGVNLAWDTGTPAPVPGSPLSPGWLHLKSGLAQIEFYQGARVLIEGPAAFQLVSSGEAFCTSGKLSAHVPPQARGFRINTPTGTIVDLGTEFGLDLNNSGAEVHVFKGEVELHRPAAPMQSLKEGQAMAFAHAPQPLAANAAAFASLTDLDQRSADSQRSQFERWQAAGARWNSDPGLRLRFDFQDNENSRSLQNLARQGAGAPDGSIVGCDWTEGRWPGKRALDFRNVSDRVRLSLPEETAELTLTCWVRIGGLDCAFNSLFMCEGWGDGRIHWQLTRDGLVRLGVSSRQHRGHSDYDTPHYFTPERFGRWTHLAVVIDPANHELRQYINGQPAARHPLRENDPVRLGVAELGNWNDHPGKDRVAIRHLSGAMDEFALYTRALSDAEVRAMYEAGGGK